MEFVEDYLNFIKKWNSIKNERVFFIKYEDFLNINDNNNPLLNKLSLFFDKKNNKKIISSFKKVNCSNQFTIINKKYYINREYMSLYSREDLDKIKNNLIYKELIENNFFK